MRREVILFMAFALGGCWSDQGKASDVAACQIEADRFYRGYNGIDVNNPRNQYIIECMATKGYDFEVSPADCDGRRALAMLVLVNGHLVAEGETLRSAP